jgi:surface carbohydrate biosynthesis protein
MRTYDEILLPVETAARELDAKLLLGLFAAEAGFRCHIGPLDRMRVPGFPPSIYISKSVRFARPVQLMSGFGHLVVAYDEEGLVRLSDEIHGKRIEAAALRIPRLLLSWGGSNTRLWKAHPFYDGCPIVETGNPRIDLLRPEFRSLHDQRCAEIRSRYGDFVLLNTNFAMVNHFKPGGRRTKVGSKSYDREAFIDYREGLEKHKRQLFESFVSALPMIAERLHPFPLLIRPHPSENPEPWVRACQDIGNVTVVYEGSVVPWLLSAKCLLHNGCTSAVEASVLKTPALAFCPVVDDRYDNALPNDLSEKYSDAGALADRARQLLTLSPSERTASYKPLLGEHIASLDGPLACERIVSALMKLRSGNPPAPTLGDRLRSQAIYRWRLALRALSSSKKRYQDHKSRPDAFTPAAIKPHFASFAETLGRFQNVKCVELLPGIATFERVSQ